MTNPEHNQPSYVEEEIIEALHRGEERPFQAIYNDLSSALLYFSRKIVDDDQVAQDIVTECFISLWEHRATIHSLGSLRGFLYQSARNKSLTFLRDRKRRKAHHQSILIQSATAEDAVLVNMVQAEHRRQLINAIALLPKQRKAIIEGLILNGQTVRELAIALNIEEVSVQTAKRKAIEYLRQALGNSKLLLLISIYYIVHFISDLIKKWLFS